MPVLQIASAFYVYPGSLLLTFFLDEKIIEKELQREKALFCCYRVKDYSFNYIFNLSLVVT